MAKTENKGRCKSFDNQMIDFFCFPMISVLCTGTGYADRGMGIFYLNIGNRQICDLPNVYWK